MGTSKILINGIGIDLTTDTVTTNSMLLNTKAHNSNGDTILGNIATYEGLYDLVIELPEKGDIITMDINGTAKEYLVLKINNTIAEVLGQEPVEGGTILFDVDNRNYANSNLDNLLNLTYYNTLPTTIKKAIVDKNLIIYAYNADFNYDANTHASDANYASKVQQAIVGERHIYAIGIEDIEEYFNYEFSRNDIREFSQSSFWLNSAYGNYSGYGWVLANSSSSRDGILSQGLSLYDYARPAFQIDLSKISFEIKKTN